MLIKLVDIQQNDVASFEKFAWHPSGGTLFQTGYSNRYRFAKARVWDNYANVVFVLLQNDIDSASP